MLVDAARIGVVLFAQRGSHSDDFAHHTASPHHTDRAECHVGDANAPPCHHQVLDVSRIEAAVRYRIWLDRFLFCDGPKRLSEMLGIFGLWIM